MEIREDHIKPLYLQVKELIKQKIENGYYEAGQKLPPERKLCETYNVSRITIRRAIEEAIKDGILFNQYGRGTFVKEKSSNKFQQSMDEFLRLEDLLKTQSCNGKTRILSINEIPVDMQLASLLSVDVGSVHFQLKLVGYSNDEPVVIYESYFPRHIGVHLIEIAQKLDAQQMAFSSLDLYQAYNLQKPTEIKYSMESVLPHGEVKEIFGPKGNEPLMKVSSIFLLPNLEPIEYRKAYYLGEKHIFYLTGKLNWDSDRDSK